MAIDDPEWRGLSDHELGKFIHDLRLRIATCEARLEPRGAGRQRSLKLARGAFLTAGGLLGSAFDLLALSLVVVGVWDLIAAVVDDATATNRQVELRRDLIELELTLAAASIELRQRSSTIHTGNTG